MRTDFAHTHNGAFAVFRITKRIWSVVYYRERKKSWTDMEHCQCFKDLFNVHGEEIGVDSIQKCLCHFWCTKFWSNIAKIAILFLLTINVVFYATTNSAAAKLRIQEFCSGFVSVQQQYYVRNFSIAIRILNKEWHVTVHIEIHWHFVGNDKHSAFPLQFFYMKRHWSRTFCAAVAIIIIIKLLYLVLNVSGFSMTAISFCQQWPVISTYWVV